MAGLNPHAGEGGLFGDEEQRFIAPAIAAARAEGIDASGPFAPDTVFMRARHAPGHPGEFDLVVAMTHDHGLIPVKYLGVEQGVNVTLGLPFVRTSPDHGTAFDIAGSGRADASQPDRGAAHGAPSGCAARAVRRLEALALRAAAAAQLAAGARARGALEQVAVLEGAQPAGLAQRAPACGASSRRVCLWRPPCVKTKKLRPGLTWLSRTFCHSSSRCIW